MTTSCSPPMPASRSDAPLQRDEPAPAPRARSGRRCWRPAAADRPDRRRRPRHPAAAADRVRGQGRGASRSVTDLMQAAGMPDGAYALAGRRVSVAHGEVRLDDGRSGATVTMDEAVRAPPAIPGSARGDDPEATRTPPRPRPRRDRRIASGAEADLVLLARRRRRGDAGGGEGVHAMDVIELLDRLVRIDSVNPALDPRGAGEAAVAELLIGELGGLGLEVDHRRGAAGPPERRGRPPRRRVRAAAAAGGAHGHRPGAGAAARGGRGRRCPAAGAPATPRARVPRCWPPWPGSHARTFPTRPSSSPPSSTRSPAWRGSRRARTRRARRRLRGHRRAHVARRGRAPTTAWLVRAGRARRGGATLAGTPRRQRHRGAGACSAIERRCRRGALIRSPARRPDARWSRAARGQDRARPLRGALDRRLAPGETADAALAEIDAALEPLRPGGDRIVREDPTRAAAAETAADRPAHPRRGARRRADRGGRATAPMPACSPASTASRSRCSGSVDRAGPHGRRVGVGGRGSPRRRDLRRPCAGAWPNPEEPMTHDDGRGRAMAAEMAEQPAVLRGLPGPARGGRRARSRALRRAHVAGVVIIARGSSDHAAIYGRYLLELATRRPVSLAARACPRATGAQTDYSRLPRRRRQPVGPHARDRRRAAHRARAGAARVAVTNDAALAAGGGRATP